MGSKCVDKEIMGVLSTEYTEQNASELFALFVTFVDSKIYIGGEKKFTPKNTIFKRVFKEIHPRKTH